MAVIGIESGADQWVMPQSSQAPARTPSQAPAPPRRKSSPARDHGYARSIMAQREANQRRQVEDLQSKVFYSPNMLSVGEGMIPMAEAAKLGVSAKPTAQGIPYGIPIASLTPEQAQRFGVSRLSDVYGSRQVAMEPMVIGGQR